MPVLLVSESNEAPKAYDLTWANSPASKASWFNQYSWFKKGVAAPFQPIIQVGGWFIKTILYTTLLITISMAVFKRKKAKKAIIWGIGLVAFVYYY